MKDDDSISELGHLSMYTQWIDTNFFFWKNDESILSGGHFITIKPMKPY